MTIIYKKSHTTHLQDDYELRDINKNKMEGPYVELPDLKGRDKLKKWKVFSIVGFEGE